MRYAFVFVSIVAIWLAMLLLVNTSIDPLFFVYLRVSFDAGVVLYWVPEG